LISGVIALANLIIDGKGRVIIPKDLRRNAEIQSGDKLIATQTVEGKIILEKAN